MREKNLKDMKVAVLGGTFNPVHYGHLRIAEEVREALGLDKVLFIPTFITPHKPEEGTAPPEARLEMVRLAVEGNPFFEASDVEIKRGGRSYTIETVKALMAAGYADISLILGSDSFNDITTWCDYETLITLASFIVVERPGHAVKKPAEALPVELARKFWYDAEAGCYLNSFGKSLCYVPTTAIGISASGVREMVKGGLSVKYLVPEAVEGFIAAQGLYK